MSTRMFSLRLPSELLERLAVRARETGQSKSALAQQLIDEGLRMEAHPGIVFRDGPAGHRAALPYGPDVWQIIPIVRMAASEDEGVEEAAAYLQLPSWQIRDAVRYYTAFRSEIDSWIRRNQELAERHEAEWRRQQDAVAG